MALNLLVGFVKQKRINPAEGHARFRNIEVSGAYRNVSNSRAGLRGQSKPRSENFFASYYLRA
jgi:hypothetical protein